MPEIVADDNKEGDGTDVGNCGGDFDDDLRYIIFQGTANIMENGIMQIYIVCNWSVILSFVYTYIFSYILTIYLYI